MSAQKPTGPYVYQPYGTLDSGAQRSAEKRYYGVGGVSLLAHIDGLTKEEAEAVVRALNGLRGIISTEVTK